MIQKEQPSHMPCKRGEKRMKEHVEQELKGPCYIK